MTGDPTTDGFAVVISHQSPVVSRAIAFRVRNLDPALRFSSLALAMSAVDVYGVMSYAVAQRAREFPVRIAIGAESRSLFAVITRKGLAIAMTATIATVLLVAPPACCHPAWFGRSGGPMRVLRSE